MAGGFFDNPVLQRDHQVLAVKGRTIKEHLVTDDGASTRTVERFRTVVTALDLRTGELRMLHGG